MNVSVQMQQSGVTSGCVAHIATLQQVKRQVALRLFSYLDIFINDEALLSVFNSNWVSSVAQRQKLWPHR